MLRGSAPACVSVDNGCDYVGGRVVDVTGSCGAHDMVSPLVRGLTTVSLALLVFSVLSYPLHCILDHYPVPGALSVRQMLRPR